METQTYPVVIVGGGLSGLHAAYLLQQQGTKFLLIEGKDTLGGRVLSVPSQSDDSVAFDLGPTWFWAPQQTIRSLVKKLGLKVFYQYEEGLGLQDTTSGVKAFNQQSQTSYRLKGGVASLITALSSQVDAATGQISLGSKLTEISSSAVNGGPRQQHTLTYVKDGEVVTVTASQVIITIPPRLLVSTVTFSPALPPSLAEAMEKTPTWMAGFAKFVAVFSKPFWRERGLSGNVFSRIGPMGEIHDASPPSGDLYAMFGFLSDKSRHSLNPDVLKNECLKQLIRVYGAEASSPVSVHLKDWTRDDFVATKLDENPPNYHPRYAPLRGQTELDSRGIFLAASEVAPTFGGFLEGALTSSQAAVSNLKSP